jgi:hypothetical protein
MTFSPFYMKTMCVHIIPNRIARSPTDRTRDPAAPRLRQRIEQRPIAGKILESMPDRHG